MSSLFQENLIKIYSEQQLPEPAFVAWPLADDAEKNRQIREQHFASSLESLAPALLWMRGHKSLKYRPDRILKGCRSILVSHLSYYRQDAIDGINPSDNSSFCGRVARYARGRDYHKELGYRLKRITRSLKKLYPQGSFLSFTDTGPLDEVWLAESSGAAFRGRHGLAIFPASGSWVVIGHILSTLPLGAVKKAEKSRFCPEGCRRCIDACPTQALSYPGGIDASRCISCHTIEQRGPIDTVFRAAAADRIFGCDVCQEVCPFNSRVERTIVEGFLRDIAGAALPLDEIFNIKDRQEFVERFAGSPLMRAGLEGLIRNACTVADNMRKL